MSSYTVHEPPGSSADVPADPNRFIFVRDGFSFWAFLVPPLWMLRHRLWLVLVVYLSIAVLVQVGLHALGASTGFRVALAFLLHLFVGIEAATLRRLSLARRRFTDLGLVVGDDLEAAERRFFDAWVKQAPRIPTSVRSPAPQAGMPAPRSDIIGLFPQPGTPR